MTSSHPELPEAAVNHLSLEGVYEDVPVSEPGYMRKAALVGTRAVQGTIVAAELLPVNEVARYGAYGYIYLETGSPALAAASLAATTLLVEGSGALAAAGLIHSKGGQRIFNWVDEKSKGKLRRTSEESGRITPAVEASLAMFVGTPAVLAAKQLEDPTRTLQENRKHGIIVASVMSAYFAAEGYVAAIATDDIENQYLASGISVMGALGLTFVGTAIYKKFKHFRKWQETRRDSRHE